MWLTIIFSVPLFYGIYQLQFSKDESSREKSSFCIGLLLGLGIVFGNFIFDRIFTLDEMSFVGRFFYVAITECVLPLLTSVLIYALLFDMGIEEKTRFFTSFLFGVFCLVMVYLGLRAFSPVNLWVGIIKPVTIVAFLIVQAFFLKNIIRDFISGDFGLVDVLWIFLSLVGIFAFALAENLWFFAFSVLLWGVPALLIIAAGVFIFLFKLSDNIQ